MGEDQGCVELEGTEFREKPIFDFSTSWPRVHHHQQDNNELFFVNFSLIFLTYLMLFELFFGPNFYNFMT